jgi:hypothetical protein
MRVQRPIIVKQVHVKHGLTGPKVDYAKQRHSLSKLKDVNDDVYLLMSKNLPRNRIRIKLRFSLSHLFITDNQKSSQSRPHINFVRIVQF